MPILKIEYVYVLLGIDIFENDRIIGVFRDYESAKACCLRDFVTATPEYYDIWIEKHLVY